MGRQHTLWPSQKHPRELSRSRLASGPGAALLCPGKETKVLLGKKLHLKAHVVQGDGTGNLPPHDSTILRAHSSSPCRLTATGSCCQRAQHHPGSENKSPALWKPTKYPEPQADHRERALAVQPAVSIQVTCKQVAGAPHSKEHWKSPRGLGRRQLRRSKVLHLWEALGHLA